MLANPTTVVTNFSVTTSAVTAMTAGNPVGARNAIALLYTVHTRPDLCNDTGDLVAERQRQFGPRAHSRAHDDVEVAYPACFDLDEHLAIDRPWHIDLFKLKRVGSAEGLQSDRFHSPGNLSAGTRTQAVAPP